MGIAKKKSAKKAVKKSAAKKGAAKKSSAKKAAPKKAAPKKAAPKKSSAKKAAPKKAAPKKAAPKKAAPKKAAPQKAAPKKAGLRRDATGHLDARYARELRDKSGRDTGGGRAFVEGRRSEDDLAEELGEEAVETMTTGEDDSGRLQDRVLEERGGPFVVTTAGQEFAEGVDASNPRGSKREPFPRT